MDKSKLAEELTFDEALRLKPYRDTVGKLTIGIGRNLTDRGISKDEALLMLNNDIDQVQGQLDTSLPWWRTLSDARQRVLANMAFNMGINSLLGFKTTLSLIQAGKFEDAATNMLRSLWAQQVGSRATRLAKMMKDG